MGVEEGEEASSSPTGRVKFFCSYGGKIMPRPSDGILKYVGGDTRVVAVPRSITFSELMKKVSDLFDGEYVLKYQIASQDLDSLISVKSDEDIRHLLDEYDRLEREGTSKLRTFLFPSKPVVIESQTPLSVLGPHALEQRFVDAINGIVRSTNLSIKPPLNVGRLKSYSPSPTEGSPLSLSPRSFTHISSANPDSGGGERKLTRVPKVHSSPNLASLGNQQQSPGHLYANSYTHQQPIYQYYPSQQPHQHYHHRGYQSPVIPQDHHNHIHTHHGFLSPTLPVQDQHILQSSHHQGYQSPTNPQQDHHHHIQSLPVVQPPIARGEFGKIPFAQPQGQFQNNPSSYYPLFKAYPGSGGQSRWGHLEQYATAASYGGSTQLVRADIHPRSPGVTWE